MKILLTGATGMLGSSFLELFGDQHEIVTVGRNAPRNPRIPVVHISHDFSSQDDLNSAIAGLECDAVVHLAQSRSFRDFPNTAEETFRTNTYSTLSLLEFCRQSEVKTFVFASTGGLYAHFDGPLLETGPLKQPDELDAYFASKLASEALCGAYSSLFRVVVPRFFFPFGREQDKSQLFPRLVESVRDRNPVRLGQPSGLIFNPIPAEDAARAIYAMLRAPVQGPINVAGAEVIDLRSFVEHIADALNTRADFRMEGDAESFVADTTRLRELSVEAKTTLVESIKTVLTEPT